MRMRIVCLVAAAVIFGILPPPAAAQTPVPTVTINGLMQQVTQWSKNMSLFDQNLTSNHDKEWYARTRLRLDPSAQIGKVKAVARLEFDQTWGDVGCTGCIAGGGSTAAIPKGRGQQFSTNAGSPLNTDILGAIETTWLYTEFPFTGDDSLLPFIPVNGIARLGLQPFQATYKPAVLAASDLSGGNLDFTVLPNVRLHFTYVQVQEQATGARDAFPNAEDWAGIASIEIMPFEGLDLRPIYSYFGANGGTDGAARFVRGGLSNTAFPNGRTENRHTIGLDARYRRGPFSLQPTVFYQFGSRQSVIPDGLAAVLEGAPVGTRRTADISAWFVDVRGGYRIGPVLIEAMVMYTSGNEARDRLTKDINFYQPLTTDGNYYVNWANILGQDIDFTRVNTSSGTLGDTIGYDRYGRKQIGARVFYDITPNLSPWLKSTVAWTDKAVDRDSVRLNGLTPDPTTGAKGESTYLGTEVDVGFTWRFAPGIAFDAVYAYLFTGDAFSQRRDAGSTAAGLANFSAANPRRDAQDVQAFTARVQFAW
jgi:hypothetical protein